MADATYVIDLPVVIGNTSQTLANLTALRNEMFVSPKPEYNVHGHHYDWPGLYKLLSDQIDACMRQLNKLQPYEIVSIAR